MTKHWWLLAGATLVFAACDCSPVDVDTHQYACVRDADCGAGGLTCVAGVCRPPGTDAGTSFDAGTTDGGSADAGGADAGEADAGADAGAIDAGPGDAGSSDAGAVDAGSMDAGSTDAGAVDAGSTDAGSVDAGSADAGSVDAGSVDAGSADAGSADAGSADAGLVDAGPVDAGPTVLTGACEGTGWCWFNPLPFGAINAAVLASPTAGVVLSGNTAWGFSPAGFTPLDAGVVISLLAVPPNQFWLAQASGPITVLTGAARTTVNAPSTSGLSGWAHTVDGGVWVATPSSPYFFANRGLGWLGVFPSPCLSPSQAWAPVTSSEVIVPCMSATLPIGTDFYRVSVLGSAQLFASTDAGYAAAMFPLTDSTVGVVLPAPGGQTVLTVSTDGGVALMPGVLPYAQVGTSSDSQTLQSVNGSLYRQLSGGGWQSLGSVPTGAGVDVADTTIATWTQGQLLTITNGVPNLLTPPNFSPQDVGTGSASCRGASNATTTAFTCGAGVYVLSHGGPVRVNNQYLGRSTLSAQGVLWGASGANVYGVPLDAGTVTTLAPGPGYLTDALAEADGTIWVVANTNNVPQLLVRPAGSSSFSLVDAGTPSLPWVGLRDLRGTPYAFNNKELWQLSFDGGVRSTIGADAGIAALWDVCQVSPTETYLATSGGALRWNGTSLSLSVPNGITGGMRQLACAPNGKVLAVAASNQLFLRDPANSSWTSSSIPFIPFAANISADGTSWMFGSYYLVMTHP